MASGGIPSFMAEEDIVDTATLRDPKPVGVLRVTAPRLSQTVTDHFALLNSIFLVITQPDSRGMHMSVHDCACTKWDLLLQIPMPYLYASRYQAITETATVEVIEGSKLYGNDFHLFSKATSDPYVRIRLADDVTRTALLQSARYFTARSSKLRNEETWEDTTDKTWNPCYTPLRNGNLASEKRPATRSGWLIQKRALGCIVVMENANYVQAWYGMVVTCPDVIVIICDPSKY